MREYHWYHWATSENHDKFSSLLEKCPYRIGLILPCTLHALNEMDFRIENILKNDQRLIGIIMWTDRYMVDDYDVSHNVCYDVAFSDENSAILFKLIAT